MEKETVFVVGHDDLTEAEFDAHYRQSLAVEMDLGTQILIGDLSAVDQLTQKWLVGKSEQVRVYCLGEEPKLNLGEWPVEIGFETVKEMRAAMFYDSTRDLAWQRPGHTDDDVKITLLRRDQRTKAMKPKKAKNDRQDQGTGKES